MINSLYNQVMRLRIFFLVAVALVFRLLLIPVAHHGDLNNNISWGQELLSRGVVGFYGSSDASGWPYSAPNQPPLYIILFAGVVWLFEAIKSSIWFLNNLVGIFPSSIVWLWEGQGMDIMVKLPGIIADLGIGLVIYRYITKVKKSERLAIALLTLWLFNPITWYNSAIWGQTDSIVNFLGLIAVFALLKRRIVVFTALFTVAFLFKGSLGIFIPLLFVLLIKQKHSLCKWGKAVIVAFLITFVSSIWFHPRVDFPLWLIDLYKTRILPGEIGYLTANAFNFWWLVDSGQILDSTWYFGLSARVWGLTIALTGMLGIGYWFSKGKTNAKRFFLSLVVTSLLAFLFMTRIHERYLYPFFPYATILVGIIPTFWIPYTVLSIVHLLNLYNLFWAPSIPFLKNLYGYVWFPNLLSVISLGTLFYYLRHFKRTNI